MLTLEVLFRSRTKIVSRCLSLSLLLKWVFTNRNHIQKLIKSLISKIKLQKMDIQTFITQFKKKKKCTNKCFLFISVVLEVSWVMPSLFTPSRNIHQLIKDLKAFYKQVQCEVIPLKNPNFWKYTKDWNKLPSRVAKTFVKLQSVPRKC